MNLVVYLTKGYEDDPAAPTLFLQDAGWTSLPFHPRGREWAYLRELGPDDPLRSSLSPVALRAIDLIGFYILER